MEKKEKKPSFNDELLIPIPNQFLRLQKKANMKKK